MTEVIILTAAYLLDLAIGDPKWLPHPVRWIGWGIQKMERTLRKSEVRPVPSPLSGSQKSEVKNLKEKLSGVVLVVVVVGSTYSIFFAINYFLSTSHFSLLTFYLSFILLAVFIATTIATRELIKSSRAVIDEIKSGDIERARDKLGMIVGRDTGQLDPKDISKATIETLAENASDGVIAPMFYLALGGLPLAMAYKAVNTLDSMVGYRNEKYTNFGWAAAKLDDIANYIPARITGLLIVIATFLLGGREKTTAEALSSLKIMLRDGRKHLSPNSGIPEAAMAGALGVRLGGPSMYGGIWVEKPYIGEETSGGRGQSLPQFIGGAGGKGQVMYLNASENAISIVRITSLLGFGLALVLLYLRSIICCG